MYKKVKFKSSVLHAFYFDHQDVNFLCLSHHCAIIACAGSVFQLSYRTMILNQSACVFT